MIRSGCGITQKFTGIIYTTNLGIVTPLHIAIFAPFECHVYILLGLLVNFIMIYCKLYNKIIDNYNAAAFKYADGKKIDGRRILVDVERSRTVKNWLPRRLGKYLKFCYLSRVIEKYRH